MLVKVGKSVLFSVVISTLFISLSAVVLYQSFVVAGLGVSQVFAETSPVEVAPPTTTLAVAVAVAASSTPYEQFTDAVHAAKIASTSSFSLQFFGDIMLDRNVAKNMGAAGLDYIFSNLSTVNSKVVASYDLFGSADLTIANLEGPFAPKRIPTSKEIAFRFDPKLAAQLRAYGFQAVSLANNHTTDMGLKNVEYTRTVLRANSINFFGQEYVENPKLTWYAGVDNNVPETVAFIGFETVVHKIDKTQILKSLEEAKQKARYIIVNVHGGTEYQRISNKSQRELYRWLIDNGATAVIAHHPHVVQEAEIYKGKPIFYSLGNFIFDQYFSNETQEGLSVGLILSDGKVIAAHLFPFYSVKSKIYIMKGERREKFLEWMNKNSRLNGGQFKEGIITL